MYAEDLDLCWRLNRDGWRVAYEPAGSVVHVQGASTSRRPYRMLVEHHRSAWRFAKRRYTGARIALLPFVAIYLGIRAALALGEHACRALTAARSY
jgi:N-acetylglucosaminyl-diphospho-decaprenol L-rhamnosyltransferase